MTNKTDLSTNFINIVKHIDKIYAFHGAEKALEEINRIIRSKPDLPNEETEYIHQMKVYWHEVITIDCDHIVNTDNEKQTNLLLARAYDHYTQKRYPDAIKLGSCVTKHSTVGSSKHQKSLSLMADSFAALGDYNSARVCAELCLLNIEYYNINIVIEQKAAVDNCAKNLDIYPMRAALSAIQIDDSNCWHKILELVLPSINKDDIRYEHIVAALNNYHSEPD